VGAAHVLGREKGREPAPGEPAKGVAATAGEALKL
jgi:hypothetical protein